MRVFALVVACWAVLLASAGQLQAGLVTLTETDFGRYSDTGTFTGTNYATGQLRSGGVVLLESRSYSVFDLSGIDDPIVGASLRIFSAVGSYRSDGLFEDFDVFDVATSIPTLTGGTGGVAAFNDLGSGVGFGSQTTSAADEGGFVEVSLGPNALASLNASSSLFAFGIAVTSLTTSGNDSDLIFAGPADANNRFELVLETAAIPEPSSLALCGIGACVASVGAARRRRREK